MQFYKLLPETRAQAQRRARGVKEESAFSPFSAGKTCHEGE